MSDVKNIWVIAETEAAVNELVSAARSYTDDVTLVYGGPADEAKGATLAYCIDCASQSFVQSSKVIASLIKEARPSLVFVQASVNGRLIAASIAAELEVAALTDPIEFSIEGNAVVCTRMMHGGVAIKTEKASLGSAIVITGSGLFEQTELSASKEMRALSSDKDDITFISRRPSGVSSVDLSASKNIVGVGRGLGSAEALTLVREFANRIGGEIGCTRPVAEENKWMPKETYIGVSGKMLKPSLYVGIGLSGQIQHMIGVNKANTVFAINKDKNAPIFKQCDYGLVGDFNVVLPKLIEKLG